MPASISARFAAVLLIATSFSTYAQAQDDCQLRRVGIAPLFFDQFGRPMVPTTIEGRNKFIVIDTGGFTNTLQLATARELDLRIYNSRVSIVSITGEASSRAVTVSQFLIGNLNSSGHELMITPGFDGEVSDTQPVGTLVSGVFRTFDLELNFGGGTMNLYSQDHCEGAFARSLPAGTEVSAIPFTLDDSFHIVFPVTVDGVEFNAILDTGAATTTLSLPVAERHLGVVRDDPDLQEVGDLEGRYTATVYAKQFDSLQMGEIVVPDPELILLPDMINRNRRANLGFAPIENPTLPDVILGMSILRFFHIYIAFGEETLYLAPDFEAVALALGPNPESGTRLAPDAQQEDGLIRIINRAFVDEILAETGYTVTAEENGVIAAAHPSEPDLFVSLLNCRDNGECVSLRLRGGVPIGGNAEARRAALAYDRAKPMAYVSVFGPDNDRIVAIGRDLWLGPGRTRENILAEIRRAASLTAEMTDHLNALDDAP